MCAYLVTWHAMTGAQPVSCQRVMVGIDGQWAGQAPLDKDAPQQLSRQITSALMPAHKLQELASHILHTRKAWDMHQESASHCVEKRNRDKDRHHV